MSRSMMRAAGAVVFGTCALGAQSVWAADVNPGDAPATAVDATPAASPAPQADKPQPISEPPKEGPKKERDAKNAIYVEGLGPGLIYSVNYDRTIGDFAVRVGFGYLSVGASATSSNGTQVASESARFLTVPIEVSYLGVGGMNNMLELGAGATILNMGAGASFINADNKSSSSSGSATFVLPNVLVGYRYQPADGGFFFKGGLTGVFAGSQIPVFPWPYVALGGVF